MYYAPTRSEKAPASGGDRCKGECKVAAYGCRYIRSNDQKAHRLKPVLHRQTKLVPT